MRRCLLLLCGLGPAVHALVASPGARRAPALARPLARPLAPTLAPALARPRGGALSSTALRVAKLEDEGDDETYAAALRSTTLLTGGAVALGAVIYAVAGAEKGLEYFAGYIVEQSLSVDNLFVFVLLFDYFNVPKAYQGRVLKWGIAGAVVFRGIFVALGAATLARFQGVLLGFAGILLFSAYKLLTEGDDDDDEDLAANPIVRFASDTLDATDEYDGDRFFTRVDGVRRATPLLLVLACIELSDLVFAVDSVPAVFGVTQDPVIVYVSNLAAITGLRALYSILAQAIQDLPLLKPSVALVLAFVGGKLTAEFFGADVPTPIALAVIVTILGGGVGASLALKGGPSDGSAAASDEPGGQ